MILICRGLLTRYIQYTVEPPNKGHIGDNINSAVVSFVEKLSSFGGSKCIRTIGKQVFGTLNCVLCIERSIILCPYLGGSTIGGSTVTVLCWNQVKDCMQSFLNLHQSYLKIIKLVCKFLHS